MRHGRGADDEPDGGDKQPGDGAPHRGEDRHPCLSPRIPKDAEGREPKESANDEVRSANESGRNDVEGRGPGEFPWRRAGSPSSRLGSGRGGARRRRRRRGLGSSIEPPSAA